jgi:translation initiation factor IF-3
VTIMFRGREQSRPELGFRLLQRLAGDVEELGFVESQPKQDGRNMIMVIGPHKKKNEAKAHASGQSHSRSVPSPRPAAPAAPDDPAAPAAQGSPAAPAAQGSPAAPAAQGSRVATVAPEPATSEPAADGATVPGPA